MVRYFRDAVAYYDGYQTCAVFKCGCVYSANAIGNNNDTEARANGKSIVTDPYQIIGESQVPEIVAAGKRIISDEAEVVPCLSDRLLGPVSRSTGSVSSGPLPLIGPG